jgi:pyrroline-5-carboxylate reductase
MGRSILSGVLDALKEAERSSDSLSASVLSINDAAPGEEPLTAPSVFSACVKRAETAAKLRELFGESVAVSNGAKANAEAAAKADYVLLGCKPQVARDLLTEPTMAAALKGKVVVSILAGTTIATLQGFLPDSKVIRVMPNTPSRIRQGMSVIVSGDGVSAQELDVVSWIFKQVGKTLVMDEKHIDAATALCGSGPAFMAVILESVTDGGVMMGIPRAQAEELAAQTMLGTAAMVQSGQNPALIRNAVATPGGCTIGGLLEMEDGKIRSVLARTIQTASQIATALGKN